MLHLTDYKEECESIVLDAWSVTSKVMLDGEGVILYSETTIVDFFSLRPDHFEFRITKLLNFISEMRNKDKAAGGGAAES